MSIAVDKKSPRGRPPADTELVTSRVARPVLAALDAWAQAESIPEPWRPEAVRRALAEHLRAKGYLLGDASEPEPPAPPKPAPRDRYADADPNEAVMVPGVGPMILARAVRKRDDWREHHGLELVSVFRGADKEPGVFDMRDLVRLAELERFR